MMWRRIVETCWQGASSEGQRESSFDTSAATDWQNLLMNRVDTNDKAFPAKGVTAAGGQADQRSLLVENFVAVAMMPVDLAHAAVNQNSSEHW